MKAAYQVGGKGGQRYETFFEAASAAETIFATGGRVVCIVKQEPKPRKHWHVGNGMPGYLFNSVASFTNRRDAESRASRESRDYLWDQREHAAPGEKYVRRISRNQSGAVYVVDNNDPWRIPYQWEVYPCDEPDCYADNGDFAEVN